MHLIANAVEATKEEGKITIRTFVDQNQAVIRIADTGVGIHPERMDRLFEPNFKTQGARVKTSLGLFISYQVMRKHEGRIEAESRVGCGSTFSVFLPLEPKRLGGRSHLAQTVSRTGILQQFTTHLANSEARVAAAG